MDTDIRWKQRFQNFAKAFALLQKRNLMAHTYDEAVAELACSLIANRYSAALQQVFSKLRAEL